jgi:hypothetical protein
MASDADFPKHSDAAPPIAVQRAIDAMHRLCSGELEFVVGHAQLAGLETAVVLAVTPGGLVPLFTHVSDDVYAVLAPLPKESDSPPPQLN